MVRCAVDGEDLLTIQVMHSEGVAVLACRGEIDVATAPHLRESVERACELGVPVVLDMSLVTFMDSSGISALLLAFGVVGELPNKVHIQSPSDEVRRVLSIAGLDELFLLNAARHDSASAR